ncbi:TMEM175 family protein [Paenarthrobacter sp. PH39-S1]|uniref:TMEM175 family protein n=1 Tax=Paenarthrobacter sp. PH39-S1 TaxID=3046204 RepID=UPI0024B99F42|nr:TMEM175 family protein [Paenarthrobacter sp. PH39-S1]MDJ0357256.1 TMEM175 family protein [Paenarthrobacter sp. PH39-S1]
MGNFWLVHHRLYEQVIDYNVPLLWANLLWLLTIVFLPFPTELLGSGDRRDLATYAVYIGTLVFTSAAILLQQVIVVRSADLHAPGNQRPRRCGPT